MKKFEVQMQLEKVRDACAEWNAARREFRVGYNRVMNRLLHEAVRNRMSVADIAAASGLTKTQVRRQLNLAGFSAYLTKTTLSDMAAKALSENAELLGVDPREMDLTSPLAYLPMGEKLKRELDKQVAPSVTEFPETEELIPVNIDDPDAVAAVFTQLRRGGTRFKVDGEVMEVRLNSLGYDPEHPEDEQFGFTLSALKLMLRAEQ